MSQTNEFTCPTGLKQLNICGTIGVSGSDQIDYSFEEQWTGRHWVDGKKIYQKTFDFGAGPNRASKNVPHGISDLETVIDYQVILFKSGDYRVVPNINVGYPTRSVNALVAGGNMNIWSGDDFSPYQAYFTLQYVKTTD